MTRRLLVLFSAFFIAIIVSALLRPARSATPDQNHEVWLSYVLQHMDAIKPGMTRADLLRVFRTDGKPSREMLALTRLRRTFVSQDCPYFRVDVEFEPATRAGMPPTIRPNWGFENDQDVIVKVSKPYVEFPDTN